VKGDHLGEFEELTLLATCVLRDDAYGVTVQEYLERVTRRTVTMGAVYASLDRLEGKGLLRSAFGEAKPSAEAGLAAFVPARRAARIDPAVTLKQD
jgi:hypothetical protein